MADDKQQSLTTLPHQLKQKQPDGASIPEGEPERRGGRPRGSRAARRRGDAFVLRQRGGAGGSRRVQQPPRAGLEQVYAHAINFFFNSMRFIIS